MKKCLVVSVALFMVALASTSWGFIVPEWAPEDWEGELMGWAVPPVMDGDISEWQAQDAMLGIHTFTMTEHFLRSVAGKNRDILPDADDLDFQIWGGWCPADNRLYFAGWVNDNVYMVNIPEGTPVDYDSRYTGNDAWELEIDANASGDLYNLGGVGENAYPTEEERRRYKNAASQQWVVHPGATDYNIVYNGFATWVLDDKGLTDSGFSQVGTITNYEYKLAPFNDIDCDGGTYELEQLSEGTKLGVIHVISDWDAVDYHNVFLVINQQTGTFQDSNKFAPFVCGPVEYTAVEQRTWGQIKAALE